MGIDGGKALWTGTLVSMKFSIAGVVVLVPTHLRFLPNLIDNLNQAQPAFSHLLIVASGFASRREVLRIAKRCQSPRVSVYFSELGSAGKNRNCAWDIISEDLICFLDGDDLFAPDRNSVILSVFESTQCDLFLHGYDEFSDANSTSPGWPHPQVISQADLVLSDQLSTQPERDRGNELRGKAPSTNLVFVDPKQGFPVHHAHATVRTKIGKTVKFHEVFGVRNEDGVFAQDVLEQGGKVALSQQKLSLYRQGARAKPTLRHKNPMLNLLRVRRRPQLITVRSPSADSAATS